MSISPKVTLSDVKLQRNRERVPVRSFAVPMSLKNLKADLMASSAPTPSSRASSDTYANSGPISAIKKRNAPEALPENTLSPPWQAPPPTAVRSQSRQFSPPKTRNKQQQEEQEWYGNSNVPLQRPHKQQRSIFLTPRSSNSAGMDQHQQKQQQQQQQQHTTEDDSSCSSTRSIPPTLWTEEFAKAVTSSVKSTVDGIISQGSLLHASKKTFWSSLTPQDILRSSRNISGKKEDNDDVLGSGSFSKVTKVHIKGKGNGTDSDISLFALKRLKGDLLPTKLTEHSCQNGSVIAFTKAATELAREAYLLSRFDHPHIINIMGWTYGGVTSYSAYRRHDAYFLVLELLQEETLDDRIDGWNQDDAHLQEISCTQGKIKTHFHQRKIEQLTICKQVASALAYIHSKNVVYRDLKPQNIGFAREVDNSGQDSQCDVTVKLMDFGLARELPSDGTILPSSALPEQQISFRSPITQKKNSSMFDMTGTVGTIRYMAPEVCLNRLYGLECDIYSWSIVAHEILSQTKPYDDMTPDMYQSMVCQQGVRPPTQNMPSDYTVLLTQAWRTDPSKRSPLNRIERQLGLFLQQEKLIWEAQELLLDMPDKSKSSLFISQSYSGENTGTRLGPLQGGTGGPASKRRWYRTNSINSIPNGNLQKNPIFPNASMDYHGENPAMASYNHNCNYNQTTTTTNNILMYKRPPQPQRQFVTTSLSPSSRLPEPVTPDQQHRSHEGTVYGDYNNIYNDHFNYNDNYNHYHYHYNQHYDSHNGAGTRDGHLDWNSDYY